jgi:hypothetical protein
MPNDGNKPVACYPTGMKRNKKKRVRRPFTSEKLIRKAAGAKSGLF